MDSKTIDKIFSILYENNKNPQTELEYINNFTFVVAVVLSAQSTDAGVNKATKNLFIKYSTPEQFVKLGEDRLKEYVKSIGLYNTKSKNIIKLSQILVEKYNSTVPSTFEELITLPGVGRKSANVILNVLFNEATMPVDTHILRVSNRIGLSDASTPEKVEKDLMKIIPSKWIINGAHHYLVLHGRYICKARNPQCLKCPINIFCRFFQQNNALKT